MIKNLKKVISTLAAVAMLASSAAAFAVTFPDVDESASYANAVEALTTLGIVDGDDNGKFNPENTVTRAEFTKMVVEAIGEGATAVASTYTKFADAKSHWGAGYIETGVAKGFINGYDDNTFGPDDKVTYAQAVKMLVAAIGYELWATEQGGYPSGYLAWGSQLNVIKGVTGVTNDTALTRAQCATLIYNTLKAPMCRINGYDKDWQGNWYPKYEQMNGQYGNLSSAEYWESLLTEKHNAYEVKGRVMSVNKLKDEVTFTLEASANFDNVMYEKNNSASEVMHIGNTNAAELQFIYAEAIVQEDEDTNEYTIVSIEPYGTSETVTFAAADVKAISGGKVQVKREGTSKTTDYKISNANTDLYVNGTEVADTYVDTWVDKNTEGNTDGFKDADEPIVTVLGSYAIVDATNVAKYFTNNMRGTVTLVDATDTASTSTDGIYDYAVVDYHVAGQVSNVKITDDKVKITTDVSAIRTLEYSLIDENDMNVTYVKDGAVIEAADVKEDDIVLIAFDEANGGTLAGSDWAEVLVSDKTVTGTVTGKSTVSGKEYLLLDNEQYKFNDVSYIASADFQAEYTLRLDAMGVAYYAEQGSANKNLGIVVGMATENSMDDAPTVTLITAEGKVESYMAKSATVASDIEKAIGETGTSVNGKIAKLKDLGSDAAAAVENRVIEYRVSNGKLVILDADDNDGNGITAVASQNSSAAIPFKASTSKLGSYTVSETATTVIDLDAYLNNNGSVNVIAVENLEDEAAYTGWVFDRNVKTGVNGFAVLTSGSSSLRPTSSLAVVTSSGVLTDVDGVPVQKLTVARDGQEDVEVFYQTLTTVPEGSVIMYTVGADGYVETGKLHTIYAPAGTYKATMTTLLADATGFFTANIANSFVTAVGSPVTGYTLTMNTVDSDVEVFYGPVFTADANTLQLFTKKTDGNSNVSTETKAFSLAGANVYTYSYDAAAEAAGISVTADAIAQKSTTYKGMYGTDVTMTNVDWSAVVTAINAEDIAPMAAFVRVDDGDVTDVVYFIAE